MIWAAVGTDGARMVVWGLGDSPETAKEDARLWLVDTAGDVDQEAMERLSCHGISEAAGEVVLAGDCTWPVKSKLTFGEAKRILIALGLRLTRPDSHEEELWVRFKGAKSGEGYFTNDLVDAIATGKEMARRGLR